MADKRKERKTRYFQLLAIYARMDFASLTRDAKFMTLVIIADIMSNLSSISGVFLLAWKFGGIGGMTGSRSCSCWHTATSSWAS